MANAASWVLSAIKAARFAAALAIVLWPISGWPQDAAKSDPNIPVSPTAEDRKKFVDAETLRIGGLSKLWPDFITDKGSAEGPDATYYVWFTAHRADVSECRLGVKNEGYISRLSKYGFTKVIYVDDKGGSCEFNLITRVVSVPSTFLPPTEEANQIWKTIEESPAAKQNKVRTRREYAEFMGRGDTKSSVSAEGPDATYYVFHTSAYSMTESTCISLLTDGVTAKLRELGFTKVVCTDKKNASFSFDPAVPQHPMLAQASSAPAAGANTGSNSAASAAEPPKPEELPAKSWTQGEIGGEFKPAVALAAGARPEPAKVSSEEASALTGKGYVQIGTIRAAQRGKQANPVITKQLEDSILKEAAAVGGDVVCLVKQGASETQEEGSGREKGGKCLEQSSTIVGYTYPNGKQTPVFGCNRWSHGTEIMMKVNILVSEGTVWRNDPKLFADLAPHSAEAARDLRTALLAGDMAKARALVNADPFLADRGDGQNGRPLHWAVEHGTKDMVELLLAHGADVNARNGEFGVTPLHYVASSEVAELLLAHGANIDARDSLGKAPLHDAAMMGHRDVVEVLLAHNANVDARDRTGETPLHGALKDAVEVLLAHGADVNAKDKYGQTPLLMAVSRGDKEKAELLLAHGADVNAKSDMRETPLGEAERLNRKDVADLLRQYGAQE
jgi:ankyrin repeat protein